METPKEKHNIDNESIHSVSQDSIDDLFDISNRNSLKLQIHAVKNDSEISEKQLKEFYDNTSIDTNVPSNNNTSLFVDTLADDERSWTSIFLQLLTWRNILFVFISFANALLASILLPQCFGSILDSDSPSLYYAQIVCPMVFMIYNKIYQFFIILVSIYSKNNYLVFAVFLYLFSFTLIDLIYLTYLIMSVSREMNQFLETYAANGIDIFSTNDHPQAQAQFYNDVYSPRICYIALAAVTVLFLFLQIVVWLIFIAKKFIFENYNKSGSSLKKKYKIKISQIHDAILIILLGTLPPFYICSYLVERNTVNLVGLIFMSFSPIIVALNVYSKQKKNNTGILSCILYYLLTFYYLVMVLSKMDAMVYANDILVQYVLGFFILVSLIIIIPYNVYYLNFNFDERMFYVCTILFNVIFGIIQVLLIIENSSQYNLQLAFYFGFIMVFACSYMKRNTLVLTFFLLNNLCMVLRFYANELVYQYCLIPAVAIISTLTIMMYYKEPEDVIFYMSSQDKNSSRRQLYEYKQDLVVKLNKIFTIYKNLIIFTFYIVIIFQVQFLAYKSEYFQVSGISLAIGIVYTVVFAIAFGITYWIVEQKPSKSLVLFFISNTTMLSYPGYAMYLVIRHYEFFDNSLIFEAANWFKIIICCAFVIFLVSLINFAMSWYVLKNLKTLKKVNIDLQEDSV